MIKVMFGGPGDRNLLWEPDPDADPHAAARAAYESDHRHSLVAKQMQGLRRYAINRRFDGQPSFVDCDRVPQRIAELWWDSIQDVEDCFNSPSGLADLGDTSVRLPDVPINFPRFKAGPVTFLRAHPLPVADTARFDLDAGAYQAGQLMFKLYGFVHVDQFGPFDEWYRSEGARLVHRMPEVRLHVFETYVDQAIHIGNIEWGKQIAAQRVINLWFDSSDSIERAAASPVGREYLGALASIASSVEWVAMRSQEIFVSIPLRESLYGL